MISENEKNHSPEQLSFKKKKKAKEQNYFREKAPYTWMEIWMQDFPPANEWI